MAKIRNIKVYLFCRSYRMHAEQLTTRTSLMLQMGLVTMGQVDS